MLENPSKWQQLKQSARTQIFVLGGFIAFLWTLELIDWLIFKGGLNNYGVRPRSIEGLAGIFLAPLLHGSFAHLAANTVPLLVLGWFILSTRKLPNFIIISIITIFVAGLGTWLIAPRASVHIGASGLVFGYFGFLLAIAYFEKSLQAFALAVVVIFLYGSMIFGVLPRNDGISWQSHLFGFFGGGTAAYYLGKNQSKLRPVEDQIIVHSGDER